jgi:uncharacterized protein (TIGR02118 family)
MIRMSVYYPSSVDSTFDHDYYRDVHVPLCTSTWGVGAEIDKGLSGPNVASVHLVFDSMDAFGAAMALPGSAAIQADVANYTNITPVVQLSEIV